MVAAASIYKLNLTDSLWPRKRSLRAGSFSLLSLSCRPTINRCTRTENRERAIERASCLTYMQLQGSDKYLFPCCENVADKLSQKRYAKFWKNGYGNGARVLQIQDWFHRKSKGRQCKGRQPRNFDFLQLMLNAHSSGGKFNPAKSTLD